MHYDKQGSKMLGKMKEERGHLLDCSMVRGTESILEGQIFHFHSVGLDGLEFPKIVAIRFLPTMV